MALHSGGFSRGAARGIGLADNTSNANRSNIGRRFFGGRMEFVFDIPATYTFEALVAVAAEPEAVRVWLGNGYNASGTASVANIQVGAAGVANKLDATLNAATYTKSAANVTLARGASTGGRFAMAASDWIAVTPVARTDGLPGWLINIRAYFPTSNITTLNNAAASVDFTNWATEPNGREWRMRFQAIDGLNTPANFTTVTNRNQGPIIGLEYMSQGKVVSIAGFGDSITEGANDTYFGAGWGFRTALQLTTDFAVPVEWSNLGWAGAGITAIRDNVITAMNAGLRFDLAFLPNASPNSLSTPITDADIALNRSATAIARASLAAVSVPVVTWTVLPSNYAQKAYGASDSKRRDLSVKTRASAPSGRVVGDFAAAVTGPQDVNGQDTLNPAGDGVHPPSAGYALIEPKATTAAKHVLAPEAGYVA